MVASLTTLGLAKLRDLLLRGEIRAVDLTSAYLRVMEATKPLNAFVLETGEQALAMARASDQRLKDGTARPLEGLPLAIKDLFCTQGIQTTAGSRILSNFVPPYESTVTANLWRDGAVMLGKLNLDEFAMGSANVTSAFGPVVNPWSPGVFGQWSRRLVPGGSSGGSAAAVAAGLCAAAIGTDTGGSIRQPASFCGITGLKPTYGRCSRRGIIAFASSLDQAGPMTRSVRDAAIMLRSMAGHDHLDQTSSDHPVPDYEAALERGVRGLRVGIPRQYRVEGMPAEIDSLWASGRAWFQAAGATVVDIDLPHTAYALPAYYIIAPAEASSNLARYDGVRFGLRVDPGGNLADMYEATRAAGFGPEVRRRILIGTYVLSAGYYDAYYLKAQKVRARIAEDFVQAWQQCDIILTPTAPSAAFSIGEKMDNPVQMYLNDVFTVPASLAGLPALSVPSGLSTDGLPLGLQLIGRPFEEEAILAAARVIEDAAPAMVLPFADEIARA